MQATLAIFYKYNTTLVFWRQLIENGECQGVMLLLREDESFVSLLSCIIEHLVVERRPSSPDQRLNLLAWNIRTIVPRFGFRPEIRSVDVIDELHKRCLRWLRGLNSGQLVGCHVL